MSREIRDNLKKAAATVDWASKRLGSACEVPVEQCGWKLSRRRRAVLPTTCSAFMHSLFTCALTLQHLLENDVVTVKAAVALSQARDRAAGVQHRRMVAIAEG